MGELKTIREPKQKRSMEKKQLVIDTARELFCQKGYHNTTTNEIARQANISIGTLYSYFADKDTILLELLQQYNEYFYRVFEFIDTEENRQLFKADKKAWLRCLIENLIRLHDSQKAFYQELEALYYSSPAVMTLMNEQSEKVRLSTLKLLEMYQEDIVLTDLEAASVIIVDFTNSLVDRIAFKQGPVDKDRLIDMGVDTLCKMLVE